MAGIRDSKAAAGLDRHPDRAASPSKRGWFEDAGRLRMKVSDTFVAARDGRRLAATLFEPDQGNGISVLVSSATTVPRGYYAKFANFLCRRGFAVLTYDFRDIGDSIDRSWRGRPASFRTWGEEDLAGAIAWLTDRLPRNKLTCVGHSMGGTLLGLAYNNERVEAQVAIASQSAYWRNWDRDNAYHRRRIWWLSHFWFPLITPLLGHYPGWWVGGTCWPRDVALQWARWARNPHFVTDAKGTPLRAGYHRYRGRIRFYSLSDDLDSAPPRAVAHVASFFRNANVEVVFRRPADYGVESIGHFGFFRSFMSATAWEEVAEWLRMHEPVPLAHSRSQP